jgi:hypothetical protein
MVSVVGQAVSAGAVQAVAAGLPERLAPAVVFVVGGDVGDRLMQPHRVLASSVSNRAGSVMVSRCGHSPLIWPKKDSIHA